MPFLEPAIVFDQFPSIMIDGYGDLMTHFANGINCWIGFHGSSPINSSGVAMAGTYKPSNVFIPKRGGVRNPTAYVSCNPLKPAAKHST